jgi:hypothetical protein
MQTAPHPTDFFIVHAHFTFLRQGQPVQQWGSLSDGPCDRIEALDAISDHFHKRDMPRPTLANVRVFHFQADVPARDVTEDLLAELEVEPADDEAAEQDACNRADDAAKLAREAAA